MKVIDFFLSVSRAYTYMSKHRGKIVEVITKNLGFTASELAILTNSNRRSIYDMFQNEKLEWTVICSIGRVIRYDFAGHFPELIDEISPQQQFKNADDVYSDKVADIFVIDDSKLDVLVFKLTVGQALKGVDIDVFHNGETAINALLQIAVNNPEKLPKYIFLDLKMPVMDGWQFLEEFHRLNIDPFNNTKIYVLTSTVFYSEIERCLYNPLIASYLPKPIILDQLKSIFIDT